MSNRLLVLALGLGLLAVPGCNLDVPDLNNPGIDQLQVDPTPPSVNAASTGMLVDQRGGKSATVGLVNQLAILGREAYDFDPNDGRFVTELILGNLQKASAFGGQFWGGNFNNIRLGYLIVDALDKIDSSVMGDPDKASMKGFAHTIMATEFLTVVLTHNDTGAPIDVDHPPTDPLAPFVPKAQVYAEIHRLLDLGLSELMMSLPATKPEKAAFTFPLSPGYVGFDTPLTFIKFNRAIKARVAAYNKDYATVLTALGQSFMIDNPTAMGFSFTAGVYYSYSTGTGDATNGIGQGNRNIFAHPSLKTAVQLQADGKTPDARYTAKIRDRVSTDASGTTPIDTSLASTIKFQMYAASSSIALIRNEELILLESEALWFTGDHTGALDKLDVVRTNSGKLPPIDRETITDDTSFTDALLYERRYSLVYEGGHRWIDLLRFGRSIMTDDVDPTKHTANIRYPVPQGECDARPGEPACNVTSTSPAT